MAEFFECGEIWKLRQTLLRRYGDADQRLGLQETRCRRQRQCRERHLAGNNVGECLRSRLVGHVLRLQMQRSGDSHSHEMTVRAHSRRRECKGMTRSVRVGFKILKVLDARCWIGSEDDRGASDI